MKSISFYPTLFFLVFTLLASRLQAQQQLLLLNQYNGEPVAGASFRYGTQQGFSDENGAINIRFYPNDTLRTTHFTYVDCTLFGQDLQKALQSGKYYLEPLALNLQPATVLVLHPVSDNRRVVDLSYQDRLQHDAGAMLNQSPMLSSIRKSGTYGFDPVMRGFKYDQLNIVINGGQCATAACPNRMDPPSSQVAINMMKQVEILKGPYNLRYGGGFGGTINFKMPEPVFVDSPELFGRISGGFESNGGVLRSEGLLGARGKSWEFGLFGSWSEGNDYTDGKGGSVPSDFLRGSFGANLGLKLTSKQQLSLSATRNLARDSDFPSLMMDLRKDDTWLFNLQHHATINRGKLNAWNTSAYLTLVNHLMDNLLKPLNPRMMNAQTDANTQAYGGRTEAEFRFGKGHLFVGADLRVEQAEGIRERAFIAGPNTGKTFYDNVWQGGKVSRSGLFGEYRFPFTGFRFVLSSRLEYNTSTLSDPEPEFTNVYPETNSSQFNPSFSLGAVKNLSNGFNAGLWLGRAQRSGSITERYINYLPIGLDAFEMLGNPQLKPEVNNQADLNFNYKSAKTTLDLTVFGAWFQNYVSSEKRADLMPRISTSPGVRQFVNIEKAMATGFEFNWSQKWFAGLQHQLGIAYTFGQNVALGEPLPEIAPLDLRFRLSGSYFKEKLRPEFALRQTLGQDRVSTAFGETASPSFTLLDASVGYRFTRSIRATAGVQNLLDEPYFEHLNRAFGGPPPTRIYMPGRSYFITFSVDLM